MKYSLLIFFAALFMSSLNIKAGDFPIYKIYESDGDETSFEDLAEKASDSDFIFFGELHNNAVSHWLEFELVSALYDIKKQNLVLGAEMFEADDQLKIDEYFSGLISQSSFEKECRLWSNYQTDYKPAFEFAKEKGLKYIATNIPRRYASLVSKGGFQALDSLSAEAKKFIAPLPIEADLEIESYKSMDNMGAAHKPAADTAKPSMAAVEEKMKSMSDDEKQAKMKKMIEAMNKMQFLKQAQASKDATMAHFILKNYKEGNSFLHYNGAFHSNLHEGIVWFINKKMPGKKILTITTIEKDNFEELSDEEKRQADFIIVVKSNFTKTY